MRYTKNITIEVEAETPDEAGAEFDDLVYEIERALNGDGGVTRARVGETLAGDLEARLLSPRDVNTLAAALDDHLDTLDAMAQDDFVEGDVGQAIDEARALAAKLPALDTMVEGDE